MRNKFKDRLNFKINFKTTIFYHMQLCINFDELPHGGALSPKLQADTISDFSVSPHR